MSDTEPTDISEEDRADLQRCGWIVGCDEPDNGSGWCDDHEQQVEQMREQRKLDAEATADMPTSAEDESLIGSFPDCCSMCAGHRVLAEKYRLNDDGILVPTEEAATEG